MDAVDVKFAPVRGDKSDTRLEEMFKQIIERVEDLQESSLSLSTALKRLVGRRRCTKKCSSAERSRKRPERGSFHGFRD